MHEKLLRNNKNYGVNNIEGEVEEGLKCCWITLIIRYITTRVLLEEKIKASKNKRKSYLYSLVKGHLNQ